MSSDKKSVLFICLGNICRSPIAEAVFLDLIKGRQLSDKWIVDSAALGSWHVGKDPDYRATSTLESHNVPYSHKVRQIQSADYDNFDFIFGMDEGNMKALKKQSSSPKMKAKLLLLGDFDPQGDRIIRDPYYDDDALGFEKCYQQCVRSCAAFLTEQSQ